MTYAWWTESYGAGQKSCGLHIMCVQILYSAHMLRVLPKNLVHSIMAAVAVVSSEPFVKKAVQEYHALS